MNARKLLVGATLVGITLALAGMTVIRATAADDEEATKSFDLAEITCWDVMTVEDEERNIVLFLLYGYVAGQNDQTVHTGQEIEKMLRGVGEYCADNPDVVALDAMRGANK